MTTHFYSADLTPQQWDDLKAGGPYECCVHCHPEKCVYPDRHVLPCGPASRCELAIVWAEEAEEEDWE